jgi:hypothetical protein
MFMVGMLIAGTGGMKHIGALRISLLVGMGIVPTACGGQSEAGKPRHSGPGDAGQAATETQTTAGAPEINTQPTAGQAGRGEPRPLLAACTSPGLDVATGFETCAEGYSHRVEKRACGSPSDHDEALPRVAEYVDCFGADRTPDSSKCSQFAYGYCYAPQAATCVSGCVTDEDCGSAMMCVCGHPESPTGGVCQPATCSTDAECGSNSLCASYQGSCSGAGFSCQSAQDECFAASDCPTPTVGTDAKTCARAGDHRACEYCVVGRPFLVEAKLRVAPLSASVDWLSAKLRPRLAHLTLAEREALSAHWAMLGQMEHASIAAFARFQLQLLALGAPPALVEACTRAMADETEHTRICFDVASAYAARPIGPGKLDITGSLSLTSLEHVVDLVIAEGCFGETSATLEAMDAAEVATDPVIATIYAQIAADEQRHATLAFQFMRWALEQEPSGTASRIAAALDSQIATPAVRQVVQPCFEALLAHRAEEFGTSLRGAA